MAIDNFDSELGLYWYRLVKHHPRPEFETMAKGFLEECAERLRLLVKPAIHWFEMAGKDEAGRAFNTCQETSNEDFSVERHPVDVPCEYFRFRQDEVERIRHGGCTHKDDPRILIACDVPDERALGTIAHECRHLFQDKEYGPDWRGDHADDAESDARQFELQFFNCA